MSCTSGVRLGSFSSPTYSPSLTIFSCPASPVPMAGMRSRSIADSVSEIMGTRASAKMSGRKWRGSPILNQSYQQNSLESDGTVCICLIYAQSCFRWIESVQLAGKIEVLAKFHPQFFGVGQQ